MPMPKPARMAVRWAMLLSTRSAKLDLSRPGWRSAKARMARRLGVVADDVVLPEFVHALGRAAPGEIVLVGVQAHREDADALGQQRLLLGADHADGDVGLALQEIIDGIGERQLDGEPRVALAEPRQDGRQVDDADHLAGADADGAVHLAAAALGGAQEGSRGGGHSVRRRASAPAPRRWATGRARCAGTAGRPALPQARRYGGRCLAASGRAPAPRRTAIPRRARR